MDSQDRRWSLRRRILELLVTLTLAMWILGAATIYRESDKESQELFDQSLAESAHLLITLAEHEVEESSAIAGSAVVESVDGSHASFLFFQIWGADGRLLYRTSGAPSQPFVSAAETGFGWTAIDGQKWRTYSIWNASRLLQIQIGEPLVHRKEISSQIAWRLFLFAVIFLPIFVMLVWILISRAFVPLQRSAAALAERSPSDLREIDDTVSPDEVLPLLTALNRLFARLRSAMDRERRFTADAAHELRTPLAAIRAHLQVLQHVRNKEEEAEAIADLLAGVDRGSKVVDQLLTLARLDPDNVTGPQFESVDLSELIATEVPLHQMAAQRKNIGLSANTASALIQGNRQTLAVLLRNLIDNAIRYTPDGGRVLVSCGAENGKAILAVSDNGPGITSADREKVFDQFFRVNGNDAAGSGLGLSIVKRIVNQHRAQVMLGNGLEARGLSVSIEFEV